MSYIMLPGEKAMFFAGYVIAEQALDLAESECVT